MPDQSRNHELELEPLSGRRKAKSLSDVIDSLLVALSKSTGEHSSVKLSRNARGETQIEVTVRTGDEANTATIDEATTKARQVYDLLRQAYPLEHPPAPNGEAK